MTMTMATGRPLMIMTTLMNTTKTKNSAQPGMKTKKTNQISRCVSTTKDEQDCTRTCSPWTNSYTHSHSCALYFSLSSHSETMPTLFISAIPLFGLLLSPDSCNTTRCQETGTRRCPRTTPPLRTLFFSRSVAHAFFFLETNNGSFFPRISEIFSTYFLLDWGVSNDFFADLASERLRKACIWNSSFPFLLVVFSW